MDDKEITYYVNDEEQKTDQHKLTVGTILSNAGFKPPEEYELTRDDGNKTFTNLDEEIPLHKDERFTATFTGPTPTS